MDVDSWPGVMCRIPEMTYQRAYDIEKIGDGKVTVKYRTAGMQRGGGSAEKGRTRRGKSPQEKAHPFGDRPPTLLRGTREKEFLLKLLGSNLECGFVVIRREYRRVIDSRSVREIHACQSGLVGDRGVRGRP